MFAERGRSVEEREGGEGCLLKGGGVLRRGGRRGVFAERGEEC